MSRLCVLVVVMLVTACPKPIHEPVADAGPDQTAGVGDVLALSGADSHDPQKLPLSYAWSIAVAPAASQAALMGGDMAAASFVPNVAGTYVFSLTVANADKSSKPDTMEITVSPCWPVVRQISATSLTPALHQDVILSAQVEVGDEGETCGPPRLLQYHWQLVAPPASEAQVNVASVMEPAFAPDIPGAYQAQLVVTDAWGRVSPKMSIELVATSCGANAPVVQQITANPAVPRVARAGGGAVTLSAVLDDADTRICAGGQESYRYGWQWTSRPGGSAAVLVGQDTASPSFVPDTYGHYVLSLVATDRFDNASQPAVFSVQTSPCGSHRPVFSDLSTTPAAPRLLEEVQLSMRVIDRDEFDCALVEVFSYRWSFVELPVGSLALFNNASVVAPTFTVDRPGRFAVALVVTDRFGNASIGETAAEGLVQFAEATTATGSITFPEPAVDAPGMVEGDTVTIAGQTFEFDTDGVLRLPTHVAIVVASIPAAGLSATAAASALRATAEANPPDDGPPQLTFGAEGGTVSMRAATPGAWGNQNGPAASRGDVVVVTMNGGADTVADGEVVRIGNDTYEFDRDGVTDEPGAIRVDLSAPGDVTPQGAAQALAEAINALGVEPVLALTAAGSVRLVAAAGLDGNLAVSSVADLITVESLSGGSNEVPSLPIDIATNQRPQAQAGPDQNVPPGHTVALSAAGSRDPDSGPETLTYRWELLTGPEAQAVISNGDSRDPTVLVPASGDYSFQLTVSDGYDTATDTVSIHARVGLLCTRPPTITVGAMTLPRDNEDNDVLDPDDEALFGVTLDDADRLDCGDLIAQSFSVTVLTQPPGSRVMVVAETDAVRFSADRPGTYVLRLLAADALFPAIVGQAHMEIEVGTCAFQNPTAEAGGAQTVLPGQPVVLSAVASFDPDNTACRRNQSLSHSWQLVSQPAASAVVPANTQALQPSFTPDVPGDYVAELVVTDDTGRASLPDTVTITVPSPEVTCGSRSPGIVFAGPLLSDDNNLNSALDPDDESTVTITLSDADTACGGTAPPAATFVFSLLPAGSTATLATTATSGRFRPDLPGRYVIAATADDTRWGAALSTTEEIEVNAGSCGQNAPRLTSFTVGDSGGDGDGILEVNEILRVSPSVTDDDDGVGCRAEDPGAPFVATATITARPAASAAIASSDRFTPDVAGLYVVNVSVVDEAGMRSNSVLGEVAVVYGANNCGFQRPVADAGSTQTVLPDQLVVLSAAASLDPDNNAPCSQNQVLSYGWQLVSQPAASAVVLANTQALQPSFTPDVPGDYVAELVVTDDTGRASLPDTVTITVPSPEVTCGSRSPGIVFAGPLLSDDNNLNSALDPDDESTVTITLSDADTACGGTAPPAATFVFSLLPAGSTATLATTATTARFSPDLPGRYVIAATVDDTRWGAALSTTELVELEVGTCGQNAPTITSIAVTDSAPADADGLLELAERLTITPTVSDADDAAGCGVIDPGTPFTATVTVQSRPAGSAAVALSAGATGSFTPDVPGVYVLTVVVVDEGGTTSTASSTTVSVPNRTPTADARSLLATTCAIAGQTRVRVSASVSSDPDGQSLAYSWRFTSIPMSSTAALDSTTTVDPSFVPDLAGTYTLEVTITDPFGASATDTVSISSVAASTIAVNAGNNQTGVVATNLAAANEVVVRGVCADASTVAAPEQSVRWSIINGRVSAGTTTSDTGGLARVTVRLGTEGDLDALFDDTLVRAELIIDGVVGASAELNHDVNPGAAARILIVPPAEVRLSEYGADCTSVAAAANTFTIRVVDRFLNLTNPGVGFTISFTESDSVGSATWAGGGNRLVMTAANLADGEHSAAISENLVMEDDPETLTFQLTETGGLGLPLQVLTTVYRYTGENFGSDNGFTTAATDFEDWQRGAPTTSPPDVAASGADVWATQLAGNYTGSFGCTCQTRTLTKSFDLSSTRAGDTVYLAFDHYFNFVSDGAFGAVGFIDTGSGLPAPPAIGDGHTTDLSRCTAGQGFGRSPFDRASDYRTAYWDLSASAGSSAADIAWTFLTVASQGGCNNTPVGEAQGWYIDNIRILALSTPAVRVGPGEPARLVRTTNHQGSINTGADCRLCAAADLSWELRDCHGNVVDNQEVPASIVLRAADTEEQLNPTFTSILTGGEVTAGGTSRADLSFRVDDGRARVSLAANVSKCNPDDREIETSSASIASTSITDATASHTFSDSSHDGDGDGSTACGGDCNDALCEVFPATDEVHTGDHGGRGCTLGIDYNSEEAGDTHCWDGLDNDCSGDLANDILLASACWAATPAVNDTCSGKGSFPALTRQVVNQNVNFNDYTNSTVPGASFCSAETGSRDVVIQFAQLTSGTTRIKVDKTNGTSCAAQMYLVELNSNDCASARQAMVSTTNDETCQLFGNSVDRRFSLTRGRAYAIVLEDRGADVFDLCSYDVDILVP